MDKVTVADVHADVVRIRAGAEEHEVADLKLIARDSSTLIHLIIGGAVHRIAILPQAVVHEAGAVEAGGRLRAAVDVAVADKRADEPRDLCRRAGAGDGGAAVVPVGRAAVLVGQIFAGDVGRMALILNPHPAVRAAAGDGDGLAVFQRTDERAAGRPRIADVERLRRDVHGLAEIGDGHAGIAGVVAVIGDSGGEDGVVIILLDALKGAEEHGHGFLPGGGAGRVEDDAAGGVFCAVDIAVGHTELRGFLCPAGKGRGIAKLAEGVGVDGQDGLKGGGIAEVFEELEKFLPRDALIGSERAVRITGDDAVFIGLGDVGIIRIGKILRAVELQVVAGGLFEGLDGKEAHFSARDGLLEVHAGELVWQNLEVLHLLVVALKPVAVCRGKCTGRQRDCQRQRQQQGAHSSFHVGSSFRVRPMGQ